MPDTVTFIENITKGRVSTQPYENGDWIGVVGWYDKGSEVRFQTSTDRPNWEENLQGMINDLTRLRDQLLLHTQKEVKADEYQG